MSESQEQSFQKQVRRASVIFGAVACGTLLMVAASFAPLSNRHWTIALVLAVALGNASMVAAYLMHLLSEKRTIFALLAFTVFLFIGLMGLIAWSPHEIPDLIKK